MLSEGPVVTEITGLFCNINEPLGLPLERILYLLMAAVSKGGGTSCRCSTRI